MFPCCSTREDLSIDVSITIVGHIDEAKVISGFRHKSKFNFELFWKKIKFQGFHAVVRVKTFLLMYQLHCRTDIDEAMVISFLRVRTDGQTDGQTYFWNPHMETCWHTKNFHSKLVVSCRYLYASPEDGDA